jgi:hypothetical protein
MRRKPQPQRGHTSGAIAWLALFFSLASCCLSLATFLSVNQDGRLSQRWAESSRQLNAAIHEATPSRAEPGVKAADENTSAGAVPIIDEPAATAAGESQSAHWHQMEGKIDRLQTMIHTGDARAKYYVDMLRDDLQGTGGPSPAQRATWLIQALQALQRIDEQLTQNAPDAARRLQGLAQELRLHLGQPAATGAGELPADEPAPEPAAPAMTPTPAITPTPTPTPAATPKMHRQIRGRLAAPAGTDTSAKDGHHD